jgi:hypothetical protein
MGRQVDALHSATYESVLSHHVHIHLTLSTESMNVAYQCSPNAPPMTRGTQ